MPLIIAFCKRLGVVLFHELLHPIATFIQAMKQFPVIWAMLRNAVLPWHGLVM